MPGRGLVRYLAGHTQLIVELLQSLMVEVSSVHTIWRKFGVLTTIKCYWIRLYLNITSSVLNSRLNRGVLSHVDLRQ